MVASQDPQTHNLPQNIYFLWPVIPLSTKEKSLCSLPAEADELIFGRCDAEYIDLQVTDFVSFYRTLLYFVPNQKAAQNIYCLGVSSQSESCETSKTVKIIITSGFCLILFSYQPQMDHIKEKYIED